MEIILFGQFLNGAVFEMPKSRKLKIVLPGREKFVYAL